MCNECGGKPSEYSEKEVWHIQVGGLILYVFQRLEGVFVGKCSKGETVRRGD